MKTTHSPHRSTRRGACWLLAAALTLTSLLAVGCQGDRLTYERHVDDVQQDVQTRVVVE